MPLTRPHQFLPTIPDSETFSRRGSGGGDARQPEPVADRGAVYSRIRSQFVEVVSAGRALVDVAPDTARIPVTVHATTDYGVYGGIPAPRRNRVLSLVGAGRTARLNVAFDPQSMDFIEAAGEKYLKWKSGAKQAYFNFFEAQPEIGLSKLEDVWNSVEEIPGRGVSTRLEVWFDADLEAELRATLETLGLRAREALDYGAMRAVVIEAPRDDFEKMLRHALVSQLRPASGLSNKDYHLPAGVQNALVTAAASRIEAAPHDAPRTCLLDTGVSSKNPLLDPSIAFRGSAIGTGPDDTLGHGTQMAGLALFEDLPALLAGRESLELSTRLESVVVQTKDGSGDQLLPAEKVMRAVRIVEDGADVLRTFCLAMNAPLDDTDGSPSTISATIDSLCADVSRRRLFCVAAGNLDSIPRHSDYQALNDITGLMSPAQAWNAIAVSACTDRVSAPSTHSPVAAAGDLSPWSRTAVNWDARYRTAAKPDVVFEGGNTMFDLASRDTSNHAELCVLTTSAGPDEMLALTGQTSAATAAVAGLCTRIQAAYPDFWPETVRGLVIHSTDYTPAMEARVSKVLGSDRKRRSRVNALLSRFGYGRVDPTRAMENARDALTLVSQSTLSPARYNEKDNPSLGYMRTHPMPWPIDVLEKLEGVKAELRVTLSYFVEPNPAKTILGKPELYPSHGFNFDVRRPDESEGEAVARINNEMKRPADRTDPLEWTFGSDRARGSVRHDRLLLNDAADLARMGSITVFPQGGWWKTDRRRIDSLARYSLIVTIRTEKQDIYTRIPQSISI